MWKVNAISNVKSLIYRAHRNVIAVFLARIIFQTYHENVKQMLLLYNVIALSAAKETS